MPWHNKVLGYPTEIFDFVLGDGSYYSLFACLDMDLNDNLSNDFRKEM